MFIKKTIRKLINLPKRLKFGKLGKVSIAASSAVSWYKLQGLTENSFLSIGDDTTCDSKIVFDRDTAVINIGERCFLGASLLVSAVGIDIGDDVMISWGVTIVDHDSHNVQFSLRKNDVVNWKQGSKDWTQVSQQKVAIESKVWIGFGVTILKGVSIGEGSVVAAGAVVVKDVSPWTVVGGNPAKLIKKIEQ